MAGIGVEIKKIGVDPRESSCDWKPLGGHRFCMVISQCSLPHICCMFLY